MRSDWKRLALALGGLLVSAGVLTYGLSSVQDEDSAALHDGERAAASGIVGGELDLSLDPFAAASPAPSRGASAGSERDAGRGGVFGGLDALSSARDELRSAQDAAASAGGTVLPGQGPSPSTGVLAASGNGGTDWTALFEQLLEREQGGGMQDSDASRASDGGAGGSPDALVSSLAGESADDDAALRQAPPPPPPDPMPALRSMALRGVVAGVDGGIALLDGNMLRPGDTVPGTLFVLETVKRDRVVLSHRDLLEPVQLMLSPMTATTSGAASPVDADAGGSTDPAHGGGDA